MNFLSKYGVVGNWIVTLGIILAMFFGVGQSAPAGDFLQEAGTGQNFGSSIAASTFITTLFSHLTNLQVNNNFNVVGIFGQGADGNTGPELLAQVTAGTCVTGTSTVFDIVNPFAATSTASLSMFHGQNLATTTSFSVGTTTLPSGVVAATISPTLVNAASLASSSQFDVQGGQTTALGAGQVSAGSATVAKIIVGPSERLAGYATSSIATQGSSRAAEIGLGSCTYKIKWDN